MTASLFDKNKNPVSLPGGVSPVATTDSAGRYCITDTSGTLVSTVTSGGYVKLALTTLPAGHTLVPASKSPWKSTGLFGSDEIGVGTFLTHKISGLDSAYNFHFATT
ncbi:hypothetical protein AB4Z09_24480 [Rhodococcus sp. TAF43]|uniref:hypothetical protein n=1 Tax=Rhodococcus sp. TAF43 TaxID=3237483 RepID=UPI003F94D291